MDFFENIEKIIPQEHLQDIGKPNNSSDIFFRKTSYKKLYKLLNFSQKQNFIDYSYINASKSSNVLLDIFTAWSDNLIPVISGEDSTPSLLEPKEWVNSFKPRAFRHFLPIVLFTSGTTGSPKPYIISLENIFYHYLGIKKEINLSPNSVYGANLPSHHLSGLMPFFRIFLCGGKVEEFSFSNTTSHETITHLSIVNSQLFRLNEGRNKLKSLEAVLLGGGKINLNMTKKCLANKLPIFVTYGLSEMCSSVTIRNLQKDPFSPNENQDKFHLGSTISGIEIISTSPHLALKGSQCFEGYINDVKFCKMDGTFSTKDLGEVIEGKLYLKGRSDNIFISGGKNVSLKKLENLYGSLPSLETFYLKTVKDEVWGERYQLFYQPDKSTRFTESKLNDYIKENLKNELRPQKIINIDNFKFSGIKPSHKELEILGKNYPTVFLHGLFGHASDWDFITQELPNSFSLPIQINESIETFDEGIRYLYKKIKEEINSDKINLVGYSMGGRIAYHMARMYPNNVQNLFLISSNIQGIEQKKDRDSRYLSDKKLMNGIDTTEKYLEFLKKWYRQSLFSGFENTSEYISKTSRANQSDIKKNKKLIEIFSVGRQNFIDKPKSPAEQTVFIYGSKDQKYKTLGLNYSEEIQLLEFKNCGHVCFLENKELAKHYLKLKI